MADTGDNKTHTRWPFTLAVAGFLLTAASLAIDSFYNPALPDFSVELFLIGTLLCAIGSAAHAVANRANSKKANHS